ncbi:ComEA family DNA-binding protein [Salinispora mooreana]|uniref:ComEA family DNA-binding protein n=1 Tax=Salinispora mooreana TaxID=999545 RepID=UPI0009B79509|nr:helix-hairpin-helix domain-containing protein [Salinispora mooreana]
MSNVPNGPWTPPLPPANPGASLQWRIQHSWWLLLPMCGMGCLAGAGFLYVGLRARRPDWWIPGIAYTVIGAGTFSFLDDPGETTTVGGWAGGTFLAIWAGSILHACLINSAWLRWRASHTPWYAQPTAPPPTWTGSPYPPAPPGPSRYTPTSPPPSVADIMPNPATSYGAGPAAVPAPPQQSDGTSPQPSTVSPATAGGPAAIDVNTATFEQLAALPHLHTDRVHRMIAERQARRGFGSVEEIAAVADLAPHEFAHLRNLLTCTPPQWRQPDQAPPPPHGRVLDV